MDMKMAPLCSHFGSTFFFQWRGQVKVTKVEVKSQVQMSHIKVTKVKIMGMMGQGQQHCESQIE